MKISEAISTRLREILYNKNLSIDKLKDLTGQSRGLLHLYYTTSMTAQI